MRLELLYQRSVAVLLLAAVVFAPAPLSWEESPINTGSKADTLVGQILSPTFDEGLILGSRSSFSALGQRRDIPTNWPVAAMLCFSGVLLACLVALKDISKTSVLGLAPLGSRAPPQSG